MSIQVGSIVIHCFEFEKMYVFWQHALGYITRETPTADWVVLTDPTGIGVNISFQKRNHRAPHRSWLHLDLYTTTQQEEVERLTVLGARRYPWRYEQGDDFIVLEDPDGNLFCVVQKSS
jgi:catechol 2,3-dioxygenase-like lactoylglutathione lyase family enzyme